MTTVVVNVAAQGIFALGVRFLMALQRQNKGDTNVQLVLITHSILAHQHVHFAQKVKKQHEQEQELQQLAV